MKINKRRRIHKIYGTPLFSTPVELRIKQIKKQLGFDLWDSICFDVKQLNIK